MLRRTLHARKASGAAAAVASSGWTILRALLKGYQPSETTTFGMGP